MHVIIITPSIFLFALIQGRAWNVWPERSPLVQKKSIYLHKQTSTSKTIKIESRMLWKCFKFSSFRHMENMLTTVIQNIVFWKRMSSVKEWENTDACTPYNLKLKYLDGSTQYLDGMIFPRRSFFGWFFLIHADGFI